MSVARWRTPTAYFPWPHVQRYIERIDAQVYRNAMKFAKEQYLAQARPCPQCGRVPKDLFWMAIASPEPDWDAGTGQDGFLTICKGCRRQVDFFPDAEMTELQAEQWRESRSLS